MIHLSREIHRFSDAVLVVEDVLEQGLGNVWPFGILGHVQPSLKSNFQACHQFKKLQFLHYHNYWLKGTTYSFSLNAEHKIIKYF